MELNSLIIYIVLLTEVFIEDFFVCWFSYSLEEPEERRLVSLKIFAMNLEKVSRMDW